MKNKVYYYTSFSSILAQDRQSKCFYSWHLFFMRATYGLVFLLILGISPLCGQQSEKAVTILYVNDASYKEQLAAKEIQRYIYLRTDRVFPLKQASQLPARGNVIVVARQKNELVNKRIQPLLKQEGVTQLQDQEYLLTTIENGGREILLISGGDPTGTLYGAYRLAEHLGIRFYLHGDVWPETKIEWSFPDLQEVYSPLFNLRGILPFHDFPEGPDWWNRDAYKAVISQLAKLKMNFIGLHTYPQRPEVTYDPDSVRMGWDAEPTVWIGDPADVAEDGSIKHGYPASYANTKRDGDWGYFKKQTGDYVFGASQLFEKDAYGPDVMDDYMPHPTDQPGFKTVFNKTGNLLEEVFTWAHQIGVKTTVGTETPLTLPKRVKQRFKEQGLQPEDSTTIRRAYEGMFTWIKENYPLDYYWFWTPEDWTWEGTTREDVERTHRDLRQAMQAAKNVDAPFTLATSGWVLGPPYDRTLFDKLLPEHMPMSAINRQVGFTPNDTSFADVSGRPTWIIPWMEDDPAMIQPQLWVGRIRRDAAQALAYDASGLIGIHWRTRSVGPMVSELAQAGWSQKGWNPDFPQDLRVQDARGNVVHDSLANKYYNIQPSEDYYEEWAKTQFGESISKNIAHLFADKDSFEPMSYEELNERVRPSHLPRPTTWVKGPGGIEPDTSSWEEIKKQYEFVDRMEELRPLVQGKANLTRFDYWLTSFKYLRSIGNLNTIWGRFVLKMEQAKAMNEETKRQQFAEEEILPIRVKMINQLHNVYNFLLPTVSTMGDLGTVDNWERHIMPMLLKRPGNELEELLGRALPQDAVPSMDYTGDPKLIVPVVRTNLTAGKRLRIKAMVLAQNSPQEIALYWRALGGKKFKKVSAKHLNRGVYLFELPAAASKESFEYYVEAAINKETALYFPATAPQLSQTVVTVTAE